MTLFILLWLPVALIACFIWFDSKSKWYWKIPLFPLLIFSTLWVSSGYKDFMGWPAIVQVESEFQLHWAIIKESDKKILLWITYSNDTKWHDFYKPTNKTPRVIEVEYTRELHKDIEKALEMIKQGKKVGGKLGGKDEGDGEDGGGNREEGTGSRRGHGSDTRSDYHFYILPTIQPIIKEQ